MKLMAPRHIFEASEHAVVASSPLGQWAIVLIVGRGETKMREKVDPRRAQVAQVGEREENNVFAL